MMKMPLNFDWTFKYPADQKDYLGFEGEIIHIPHTHKVLPTNYFGETSYQFKSSYQKAFKLEKIPQRRYFIVFEGVMHTAKVYLNKELILSHKGGYNTFTVEITNDSVDGENSLYVEVDAKENPTLPPFGHVVDYLTFGGIYREVTLLETPTDTINTVHVHGDKSALHIKLYPNALTEDNHTIGFEILDEGKVIKTFEINEQLKYPVKITENHDLTLWHVDNPKLYTLKTYVDNHCVHETRFGLRTLRVTKDAFYLNDKPIFLRGLNRHQDYPHVGYAMPKRAQYDDVEILKYTLGVNIVRSSHYPPSKHFLDRCDELGIMVFTELPGWQHIGDEAWKKQALKDLESLVMTDYNHPSIVMIGTRINESTDDHTFYAKTRDLVKNIDSSRITGGVRYFGHSELLEDIYTVNDFYHRGDNEGLSKKKKMTKKENPYLITEYNGHMYPTKSFDDETKRINHAKRHFKVLNDAYKMKGLMGAIGWCMHDYNTHKDFGSNDHICYHGVLDFNRNEKYAASVYASQGEANYMKVLSMMHIGELPNSELKEVIVATNLEAVKVYKNDVYLGTFTKEDSPYKNLPHPPIVIKDFIGNQIHDNEAFNSRDATRIKNILLKTLENGLKMSLYHKLQMAYILFKYKLKFEDAVRLYTRYIGGWGEAAKVYRFEGIKDDQIVCTELKGYNDEYSIVSSVNTNTLKIEETYDVAKITVELKNALGERAFYANEVIELKVSEQLEIIGPKTIALQGGIQTFWVKTKKNGKATIQIDSQHYNNVKLNIEVL
ncbi:MAG: glycoside hydrolase family 2 protein [Candidatus Izemoplasmataceae bacterium]